jgi:hypothetical protein
MNIVMNQRLVQLNHWVQWLNQDVGALKAFRWLLGLNLCMLLFSISWPLWFQLFMAVKLPFISILIMVAVYFYIPLLLLLAAANCLLLARLISAWPAISGPIPTGPLHVSLEYKLVSLLLGMGALAFVLNSLQVILLALLYLLTIPTWLVRVFIH